MRRTSALLLSLLVASCAGRQNDAASEPHIGPPDWHATGANWIDLESMDTDIRPGDDFYRFVNGGWLKRTPIPEQVPWISPYVENYFLVRDRLGAIIRDLAARSFSEPSDEQRAGDLYRSFMDASTVEALGISPLMPELDAIRGIASAEQLADTFVEFNRRHFRTSEPSKYAVPFLVTARPDDRDAAHVAALLLPAGLGMANRQSYLSDDPRQAAIRAQYAAHIQRILTLAGISDAAPKALRILALEKQLAEAQDSATSQMDHASNYARFSVVELEQLVPALAWREYLDSAGLGSVRAFVVPDRAYFAALNRVLETTPLEDWRAYLAWHLLRVYSPYLSRDFAEESFSFFGRVELGNEQAVSRADQAVIEVETAFPELLGRLYVERFFSAEAKAEVTAMAEAIREQFRQSIRNLDWMSDATKRSAIDKLDKLTIKVGYPDRWRSYDNTRIDAGDLIGNLMRIHEAAYDRAISAIGKPVDRVAWQTPAYDSSAYYYRVMNELAIPAGYLLPPWFDVNAERAMNYGGIGTVIGHEMGHAFDNQGSQYDGDGNLRDWWTDEDRSSFAERTERLVEQYNRYSPAPGRFVDGRLTLSENIGDLTGLTMAYRAFKTATRNNPPPTVEGYSGEQRFFIAFATHWRALYRDELLLRILDTDGHPPQQYRANGPLANFDPFYDAFGLRETDRMFLPAGSRVSIW